MTFHSVINLTSDKIDNKIKEKLSSNQILSKIKFSDQNNIQTAFQYENIVSLTLFIEKYDQKVYEILNSFEKMIGCLPHFVQIFSSKISVNCIISLFDHGIENISSMEDWEEDLTTHFNQVTERIEDESSKESNILKSFHYIRSGKQRKLSLNKELLEEESDRHYLLSYKVGKLYESISEYDLAIESFEKCLNQNPDFKPASYTLAEVYLVKKMYEKSQSILKKMNQSSPNNTEIMLLLATTYLEQDNNEEAEKLILEAKEKNASEQSIQQIVALIHLKREEIQEAFDIIDNLHGVGAYFTSKLNETSIKLSKEGSTEDALLLYQKAHLIVKPELKFKISLNSALSCAKLKDYHKALKFIFRCKREYGSSFSKLDKIELKIKEQLIESISEIRE